jgi:hypothetical protein
MKQRCCAMSNRNTGKRGRREQKAGVTNASRAAKHDLGAFEFPS